MHPGASSLCFRSHCFIFSITRLSVSVLPVPAAARAAAAAAVVVRMVVTVARGAWLGERGGDHRKKRKKRGGAWQRGRCQREVGRGHGVPGLPDT
jgi:hypothetical protein